MRIFVFLVLVCMVASPALGASMSVKASELHILKGEEVAFTFTYVADAVQDGGDDSRLPDRLSISFKIDLENDHLHTEVFSIEPGKTIKHEYPYIFEESGYHDVETTFKWIFIDEDGRETFDKNTLKPVTIGVADWVFTADSTLGGIKSTPLASLDKTTLYVGSEDHNLYALDIADGTEKWRFAANGSINSTPAMDKGGNLYFGCEDGFVYCLKDLGETYEEVWKQPVNGPVYSSPALDEDLKLLYIGSTDFHLYALKLDDKGKVDWRVKTGGKITSSPVIGADGTVYVGSLDHHLYAVYPYDRNDELKNWKFDAESEIAGSPALDKDGTIIFGTAAFEGGINTKNGLFALSSIGNKKWFVQQNSGFFSAPVIGADGTVCIGSFSNILYGVDRKGGGLSMFKSFSDDQVASVAIGTKDHIFCGGKDGIVYGLDLMNGNSYKGRDEFWHYDLGEPITSSSPIINNGYIYFGTCGYDHGSIYSLAAAKKTGNQSKVSVEIDGEAPWPLFRGDSRNTGKTKYTQETIAPEVVSVDPPIGETQLDLTKRSVTVTFSRPMDPESVHRQKTDTSEGYYGLTIEPFESGPEEFILDWNETYTQCELKLPANESFKPYITYTATLLAKAKAADGPDGSTNNAILYNYSWTFSAMDEEEITYDHDAASSCFISQLLEKVNQGGAH